MEHADLSLNITVMVKHIAATAIIRVKTLLRHKAIPERPKLSFTRFKPQIFERRYPSWHIL
jgi:hypothetical protein